MKNASKVYNKETLSGILQVDVKNSTGNKRFAILPADVLRDPKLPPTAKLVLQAMAMEAYGLGQLAISHQALATLCGISRPTAFSALQTLCHHGLIEKIGVPEKQVRRYRLLHAKFTPVSEEPAEHKRVVTARNLGKCLQCKRVCKPDDRTGWCRRCLADARTDARTRGISRRIAREEIALAQGVAS